MRIISHLSVRVLNKRPGLKNDLHFKYNKIFYIKVLWYKLFITPEGQYTNRYNLQNFL